MDKRIGQGALLVAFGAAAAMGAAYLGEGPKRDVSLPVPEGAFVVIRGDVSALRKGAALSTLPLDKIGMWINGDRASRVCGFDPTMRVGEFLAVVPEGGDRGEFAIVAKTTVPKDDLLRCVERLAREGGRELVTKIEGRDTSMTLPRQDGELVFREGGILAIGQRPFLSTLLATLDGKMPTAAAQSPHIRLAQDLKKATEGGSTVASIVATIVLPRSLRDRLKVENAGPDGTPAMTGVLGVEALGFNITTGPSGSVTELSAKFECESPKACAEVDKLLQAQRLKLSQHLGLRIAGFGPLVDSFKTEAKDTFLLASARTRTDDLARAIGFAADYLGKNAEPQAEPQMLPPKSVPDELIKPPGTQKKKGDEAPKPKAPTSPGAH